MANISLIKPVHGSNLKDTTDNIDKNFSTIASAGLWKGETGDSAMEETIQLWSYIDDVDKFVKIDNEDVFHEIFGNGDLYDYVVDVANHNQSGEFEDFGVPQQWSLYPGNPLWVVQKPAMYNILYKWFGESIDCSCMLTVQGKNDDGSYIYKKYDIIPKLYRDPSTGGYYWVINGVKTDIPASAQPDSTIERNVRLYLIRKAGDSYRYLHSTTAAVEWVSVGELDVQPAVGDFGWMVEKKTVDEKETMILEVCMYDGHAWVPATVDDDNNNFFLSYDDAMLAYIWKEVYAALGDTYETLTAAENHSLCFPVRNATGETVDGKSHKITAKTNTDSASTENKGTSDLIIEAPAGEKANVVFSGYKNIYTKPYTGESYDDSSRLLTKAEIANMQYFSINIEDAQAISRMKMNFIDGALYRIDRAYWEGNDKDTIYKISYKDENGSRTRVFNYIRYVYLRCHSHDGEPVWDTKGMGVLDDGASGNNDNILNRIYEVAFQVDPDTNHESYDANIYNANNDKIINGKFGVITWMRDPIYENECDWDFIMHGTFLCTMDNISSVQTLYDNWDQKNDLITYTNYCYESSTGEPIYPFMRNRLTCISDSKTNVAIPHRKCIDCESKVVDTARMIVAVGEGDSMCGSVRDNTITHCDNVLMILDRRAKGEDAIISNNNISNSSFAVLTTSFISNTIRDSVIILGDSMLAHYDNQEGHIFDPVVYVPCISKMSSFINCSFRCIYGINIYSRSINVGKSDNTLNTVAYYDPENISYESGSSIVEPICFHISLLRCNIIGVNINEYPSLKLLKYNYDGTVSTNANNTGLAIIGDGNLYYLKDCNIYGNTSIEKDKSFHTSLTSYAGNQEAVANVHILGLLSDSGKLIGKDKKIISTSLEHPGYGYTNDPGICSNIIAIDDMANPDIFDIKDYTPNYTGTELYARIGSYRHTKFLSDILSAQ